MQASIREQLIAMRCAVLVIAALACYIALEIKSVYKLL